MNIGADGLKTGFTNDGGYGMVGSAVQDGHRLIVVVNGLKSAKERGDEAKSQQGAQKRTQMGTQRGTNGHEGVLFDLRLRKWLPPAYDLSKRRGKT